MADSCREPVAAVSRHLLEFALLKAEDDESETATRPGARMLQDARFTLNTQLIGDYKPVDQWQVHINRLFYRFRGDQVRASTKRLPQPTIGSPMRLQRTISKKCVKRDAARASKSQHSALSTESLTVMELGPGNGNLAACFLSHLKVLDKEGVVYPRVRYVLVDWEQAVLDAAMAHPELASHHDRVETHRGTVDRLDGVADWQRGSHHL